jgi:membrane protein YdbS with pleckstrin-like domain
VAFLVFVLDQRTRVAVVAGLAVAAVAAVHLRVMPRLRYRIHRWELGELAIATRTGWLNHETRIAPLSRVQTVDTERGPLQRILGLAKVTVTTASARGPLVIDGLDDAEAARLVEALGRAAGTETDDAT